MSRSDTSPKVYSDGATPGLTWPYVAAAAVVLLIVAAAAINVMQSEFAATTEPAAVSEPEDDAPISVVADELEPDVDEAEGRRAFAVLQDGDWTEPPHSQEITATIAEVSPKAISVEHEGENYTWPIASDAQVWRDGKPSSIATLEAGNRVTVFLQQLGSREDGWMNAVVKVDAEPGQAASPDGDTDRIFVGEVIEAEDRTITIRNQFSEKAGYALELEAAVTRGDKTGGLELVQPGDIVRLHGVRRGDRAHGYTTFINRIEVADPAKSE